MNTKNRLLLASAVACAIILVTNARASTEISFTAKGLSSWKIGDLDYLGNGAPVVQRVADESEKGIPSKLADSTFDAATKTLVNTYPWGVLKVMYEVQDDAVLMDVEVKNTCEKTITALTVSLLSFRNLGEGRTPKPTFGFEEPHFSFFRGSGGTALLGALDQKGPLMLDMAPDSKSGVVAARFGVGGGRVIGDGIVMDQNLEPGATKSWRLIARVGPAGMPITDLAGNFLDEFRKANPMILDWPDRRPIFRAFFGGGVSVKEALANLKDPGNVKPPQPDENFRTNTLKKIGSVIEACKAANAQGVILWDLEGGTFPHATTYIGDPRHIRLLNPQMELVADEVFKMLTDAGLRTGITLRPSRVIYDAEKNTARHSYTDAKDPFMELDGKVAYARERWGCTIFYVDTNFRHPDLYGKMA